MGMPGWADEAAQQSSAQAAAQVKTDPVGAVACDDGEDGDGKGRYQPVYVHREGAGPRKSGPQIVQRVMWDIDQTFEASAKRYAGFDDSRRPRVVQDEKCQPEVLTVSVAGLAEEHSMGDARDAASAAVKKAVTKRLGSEAKFEKWDSTHRKLFFYDTGKPDGCGTAGAPGPESRADMHSGWAEVSWGCAGESALTHEMVHNFGVTHCDEDKSQGNDPICRGYDKTPRCDGPRSGSVLDCGLDDFHYFHPRPAKGSYLAAHPKENVARSPYLMKNRPAKPVATRLADVDSGKCVTKGASGGVKLAACGSGEQTWVRSIGGRGYYKLKLGAECLEKGKGGIRLAKCEAGKAAQHWWMSANQGDGLDAYQVVHRSGGDPVKVGGASTFRMKQA
ncbi:ricin-type beta-trefoil lectin domain protein [Streptomyces iconiensis]|uniref:Ricin B lectin domain-containing protein n=1 Tax=Streptomyces iconiensis TaxID=1384038 RepID=A0ABT7AAH7_9ACTN|nr:ricin-type beta-trefoil lectin domain protein [Streptomyces iconiensis]MDJ1138346.1 hypothetical protein [Streptomyces iconiensis]